MLPNCDNSRAPTLPLLPIGTTKQSELNSRPATNSPPIAQSTPAAEHLDIQIADFLAQSIAVDAKQIGCPDLVAAGCRQRYRQKRMLDLAQHAVIEAGRR